MTKEKLQSVLQFYKEYLTKIGAKNLKFKHDKLCPSDVETYNHLFSMLTRTERMLETGKIDKAYRWLGFIQGALWRTGDFTLDQLDEHSRLGHAKKK